MSLAKFTELAAIRNGDCSLEFIHEILGFDVLNITSTSFSTGGIYRF